MAIALRRAEPGDARRLQEVERLAGRQFADVGMPDIAAAEPMDAAALAGYAADGRSWVVLGPAGDVVGYVVVDVVDGNAHVEQLSVVPWNAPLYRHLGFRDLDPGEVGPELAAVRDHEATLGLDPALRTCMRRPV
jgi:hypothetical protein